MLAPFLFFRGEISTFWQRFDKARLEQIQGFASGIGTLIDASRATETVRFQIE